MRTYRKFAAGLVAAAVLMVAAAPADAQVRIGIGGGPSFPVGETGDIFTTGFNIQGDVSFGLPLLPIGIRGDIAFNRFPEAADPDDILRTLSGTVSGVFNMGIGLARAYAMAGLGLYNVVEDHGEDLPDRDETAFGLNAGLGAQVWLLGIRPFVELRYHVVFGEERDQFIPLTFGLRF
jgi:opacity protein-like surface antigen